MSGTDIQPLVEQLNSKASAKRRSAAKKLRKFQSKDAGPALLEALKKELKDKRTWETQYQMIMALGESGYIESLDFLLQLSELEFEATMVYVAIGDAIIRLNNITSLSLATSILNSWITADQINLLNGGLRAVAMLHLLPDKKFIQKIIQHTSLPKNEALQFWTAAATPGWPVELTKDFLEHSIKSANLDDTKKAATAALKGKYIKWNPL